ncbi:hypothetical protein GIB67_006978 [Kingdonia uniflora]|uniref:Chitin-binding type-1 domain-containing protein n=1 Tax=Kingdonia uniflora TaxID=39325 RepID=A0A7J7NZ45_9MAGN|nr:hypothetical protein GIB67_006978 [Kingdonia uniflora]
MKSSSCKQLRYLTKMRSLWGVLVFTILLVKETLGQEQCGSQAGGALCPGGLSCSQYGFCGDTPENCTNGCQSQCSPPSGRGTVGDLLSQTQFNEILKHRSDTNCQGGFYTYDAFISAANSLQLAVTQAHERGNSQLSWLKLLMKLQVRRGLSAQDGPYAWGYCFIEERRTPDTYCQASVQWPCAVGKKYYGRGPIQISWNYNYGQAGRAIGIDLINNPNIVATDPTISFKTALWFWMTPQSPKPSCHNVIIGQWTPSSADTAAGRVPGYGVITNIINGRIECGQGSNDNVANRIGFYRRYWG